MGVRGDSRVALPQAPGHNVAVIGTRIALGDDGNLYLMRPLSPAIIYVISPNGSVLRRFTVDPGDESLQPSEMHVSTDRLALSFQHPQTGVGF